MFPRSRRLRSLVPRARDRLRGKLPGDRIACSEGCDSNESDEKTRHANGKNRKAWRLNDASPRALGAESRGETTLFRVSLSIDLDATRRRPHQPVKSADAFSKLRCTRAIGEHCCTMRRVSEGSNRRNCHTFPGYRWEARYRLCIRNCFVASRTKLP